MDPEEILTPPSYAASPTPSSNNRTFLIVALVLIVIILIVLLIVLGTKYWSTPQKIVVTTSAPSGNAPNVPSSALNNPSNPSAPETKTPPPFLEGYEAKPMENNYVPGPKGQAQAAAKTNLQSISASDLNQKIEAKVPLIVAFTSPGCGHCKDMVPRLTELLSYTRLPVYQVSPQDDSSTALFTRYQVKGVPTLISFKNGKSNRQLVGSQSNQQLIDFLSASN